MQQDSNQVEGGVGVQRGVRRRELRPLSSMSDEELAEMGMRRIPKFDWEAEDARRQREQEIKEWRQQQDRDA